MELPENEDDEILSANLLLSRDEILAEYEARCCRAAESHDLAAVSSQRMSVEC
jgi:hypothetical protein